MLHEPAVDVNAPSTNEQNFATRNNAATSVRRLNVALLQRITFAAPMKSETAILRGSVPVSSRVSHFEMPLQAGGRLVASTNTDYAPDLQLFMNGTFSQ